MGINTDVIYEANTLPLNENVNDYAYSIALSGEWFITKGAMIAYYGQIQFNAVTAYSSVNAFVAARFSSPLYIQDWIVAAGQGRLLVADRGFDVNSYNLENSTLNIKMSNLMAFEASLELKESIVPGYVTLIGTGNFLASSNGPVIFVEPPYRVDPDALLGWADTPTPSVNHDHAWMQASVKGMLQGAFGRASGEEKQFDFGTLDGYSGGTILLQSSEIPRHDPALFRLISSQTDLLNNSQALSLGQRLVARAQQQ